MRDEDGNDVPMITYRMEVGNNDGITPSNIVGAIANEADISSRFIGSIKLHDDYSTVDLPDGMPDDLLNHLKKVRVCAKPMRLSVHNPGAEAPSREPRKKKIISRDVEHKRSADDHKSGKKKPAGGKFAKGAKDSAEGRSFKAKKSFGDKRSADGSSPIKKKKTYTKKPKKAKS